MYGECSKNSRDNCIISRHRDHTCFFEETHVDGKEIDVSGILRLAYDIIF